MTRTQTLVCLCAAALPAILLSGCARGGEDGGAVVPQAVLDLWVRFAGPVDDAAYYFIALDVDGDFGDDYPVPIASGPFWANGWASGSMTHFLEYRLGSYQVFQAELAPVLRNTPGSISSVAGTPLGGDTGRYELTIGAVTPGAATVAGAGMITDATNASGQNAGTIALETSAAGQTVAGTVSFTPAASGGRAMNAAETAAISALNAGGVSLAADSLAAFGVTLTLSAAAAGVQSVQIAPATADVGVHFVPSSAGIAYDRQGTLTANSSTPTANPPIPGATITTAALVPGHIASIDVEISRQPQLIGPPFAFTAPGGGNSLAAQIDLADLGANLDDISLNVIATTELIFDPNITDPNRHCYDALGPLGNDAISFSATEYRTYSNAAQFVQEGSGDSTLTGLVTPEQARAVDIVDWRVEVRRLR